MSISNEDLEVLKFWAECKDRRINERAKIILLYIGGFDLSIIADHLNLPYRTVIRWVKRHEKLGPGGLVDQERSGRKRLALSKQRKILYFLNTNNTAKELSLFAKKQFISKDTIWRKARIGGYTLNRERIFTFKNIKFPNGAEKSGIVGLFLTPDFFIAAFQSGDYVRNSSHIKFRDVWSRPPEVLRKFYADDVYIEFRDCIKAASIHPNNIKARALDEEWQKWLNSLKFNAEFESDTVLFVIGGDISNKLVLKTLRESQLTSKKNSGKRIEVSLLPNYDKWFSRLEELITQRYFDEDITKQISNWINSPIRTQLFFSWCRVPDDTEDKNILQNYYASRNYSNS